ncbi:MAG: tetratricopeptide repeat protein [Candidatus Aureabacteria bacterium]|nr:tetratricopeptide repeat protein [Candidatus Auribacterota bacterium]
MKNFFYLCFLLCFLAFPCEGFSQAQAGSGDPVVRTTEVDVQAEQAIGSEYRSQINSALELIKQKDFQRAGDLLDEVIMAFKTDIIPENEPFIVAHSQEEFDECLKEIGLEKASWLDWSYKEAYFLKAFMATEKRDPDSALKYLEIVISFSPYDARPLCERGFILNQLKRPGEALAEYQAAYELTEKFEFNKVMQPIVLRGMGYAYIELGDLDKAEESYKKSLEIDKGNSIALQELAYIENLKKEQNPSGK